MLQLEGLSKTYSNGHVALKDVSLTFGEGVLGLLGPNGAGKTTLMSILATITKPTKGRFVWNGKDGVADPLSVRRELGFLPQDFGVYERLTAPEFLTYLGRLKGISGKDLSRRVEELLTLVNLHGAGNRRLGGFSGGMRQRVGIAQALLGDPKLVIVDEPTVGLDPEERMRFRNLLSEIAHSRVVILSTHIVSDIEAVASTIAVMREGRLVLAASPEELLRRAEGRVFVAIVPSDRLPEIQKTVILSSLIRRADGVHVRYVGESTIPGSRSVEPQLEDAYLLATATATATATAGLRS